MRATQSGASSTSVLTSATYWRVGGREADVGGVGEAGVLAPARSPAPSDARPPDTRASRRASRCRRRSSRPPAAVWASIERRQPGSQRRPFQLGMTIVTVDAGMRRRYCRTREPRGCEGAAGAAVPARGGAVGIHDPAGDRPARRGADAPGGSAARLRAVALPGLLAELPAGATAGARRPARAVRRLAARLAGGADAHRRRRGGARVPASSAGAEPASGRRCWCGWRWPVRWRGRPGPGPNPPALLLGFGALLAALRERPALAGALAGAGVRVPIRARAGGDGGGAGPGPAGGGRSSPRRSARSSRWCRSPIVAPDALWHDTFGFYGIQGLQRLPFPLGYGGSLKPNKLLEFYLPLVLVAGVVVYGARRCWLGTVSRWRSRRWCSSPWPTCWAAPMSSTSSRSPRCCRSRSHREKCALEPHFSHRTGRRGGGGARPGADRAARARPAGGAADPSVRGRRDRPGPCRRTGCRRTPARRRRSCAG